ncbi:MAG: RNA-splicing ligase RtcB [Candidatus Glassbacteria bacterium RIFCSPLOWO2_12_FULL_58_11]|uniref:tRNA-splicing ligase RtcB n=1 Tax=Candidatus Glassbacteria bacterium RIFCSPLOWO2_12_FULL_58_11 TaxID=1817867 RepID=A0A1F5YMB5_9BACT|nr:MAG: RNA-splicing ligase RtcB [Candidatus Glassbacteria bacterium RIFCSPLOWO2_12_FULL_58_11]
MEFKKLDNYRWEIPRSGGMRVPGLVYASEKMLESIRNDNAVEQVANVAWLPGVVGSSMAMPDIHWGYGFPIGGVAAMDAEEGVISPGGVGYDINCGVRLMATELSFAEVKNRIRDLVSGLYRDVPCGVGEGGDLVLERKELEKVAREGARWMAAHGFAGESDIEYCEDGGCFPGADPTAVSDRAFQRGKDQLGTLGSGNHFVELQEVSEIFDEEAARAFGLWKGQLVVFIHSGSRGFGYQICEDSLNAMNQETNRLGFDLPDRQLACAYIESDTGRRYLGAMAAAANYGWANRQLLMHRAAESLMHNLKIPPSALKARLVYDIGHNNAKFETHEVEGRQRRVLVHRKGATRSFGPGRPEVPAAYRSVGQPVLVPGDMGRASYVLAGNRKAMNESFGSSCHGAGRVLSRTKAIKQGKGRSIARELEQQGIFVLARGRQTLSEEMPEAYKDVNEVVEVVHQAGLARKVAKMRPAGVVKG